MTAVIPRWLNLGVLVQSSEHEREEPGNSACQGCLVSPRQAPGVRLSPPIRLSRVASCKETRTQALRFFWDLLSSEHLHVRLTEQRMYDAKPSGLMQLHEMHKPQRIVH